MEPKGRPNIPSSNSAFLQPLHLHTDNRNHSPGPNQLSPANSMVSVLSSPGTQLSTSPSSQNFFQYLPEFDCFTPIGSPTIYIRGRRSTRSPEDNLLETIASTLKKRYSSKEPWQKPLPWLPNKKINAEDSYVEFEIGELNRAGRFVRQGDYNAEDIFKSYKPNEEAPTKILLQGEAGFGKTTICTKMALDWSTRPNSYLSHFKIVIFFRLRNLMSGNLEDTILNLMTKTCQLNGDQSVIHQRISQAFRSLGPRLLLILDGLDELPSNSERSAVERVIKIQKGEPQSFLCAATVLVTTRPMQPSNVVRSFQQYLNIKGFSPIQQDAYINRNFMHAPSKAKLLKIELLRPSGNLYGLGRCPLMLSLICFLHQKEDLSELRRKTDVFMAVLRFLAGQCAENLGLQLEQNANDLDTLPFHELFVRLGYVCLTALTNRRLHVREKEIIEVFPEEEERNMALGMGILKRVSMFFRISDDVIYETVYKSLMEFLAALYLDSIFKGDGKEQEVQIQDIFVKCDPQTLYQIVIFLCGLLGPRAHKVIKLLTIPEITGPSGLAIIPLDLNVIVPDDLQDANLRVAFVAVLLNECGSSEENLKALLDRVNADDRIEHSVVHLSSMFWKGYTDLLTNETKKIHRLTFVFNSTIATPYHNLLLQHVTTALREAQAVEEVQIAWVPDGLPSEEFTSQEYEYQASVMDSFCAAVFSNPIIQSLIIDVPQPLLLRFFRLLRTACPRGSFRTTRIFGRYGHEILQRLFQEHLLESSNLHEKFNKLDIGFTMSSDSSFSSLLRTMIMSLTSGRFDELVVCDGRREVVVVCTQSSHWKPIFDVTVNQEEACLSTRTNQKLPDVIDTCSNTFPPADHDMLFEIRMQKQQGISGKPFRLFLGLKNCLGTWKDFIQQGATCAPVSSEISFRISQIFTFCSQDEGTCVGKKACDVSGRMKRELASCLGINSIFGISTFFRYPALLS